MGEPERPTLSPEQIQLQQQARADKIEAIQDKVGTETRDLLIRFGRRQAFAGSSGSAAPAAPLDGGLGLFGGRKLQPLRVSGAF